GIRLPCSANRQNSLKLGRIISFTNKKGHKFSPMALPLNPTSKLAGISHGADAAAVPSATNRKLTFRSPADCSHSAFCLICSGGSRLVSKQKSESRKGSCVGLSYLRIFRRIGTLRKVHSYDRGRF